MLRAFDLAGIAAVSSFVIALATDLPNLRWEAEEIELRLAPEELDAGFREGAQWHSIYRDDRKVGFMRSIRRRAPDGGIELSSHTQWRSSGAVELEIRASLDEHWTLLGFEAEAVAPMANFTAEGRVEGEQLVVSIEGPLQRTLRFPLDGAPAFDFSVVPLLMRRDLEVGTRVRFEVFDPATMSPRPVELEYLGRDSIPIMGESVSAHHLRQRVAGQVLESWVNDLGEIYREQLPGGLVSVRETEAEATFFPEDTEPR